MHPNLRATFVAAITVAALAGRAASAGTPGPGPLPPAPPEYDEPAFHLVVCRPMDSWSGDTSAMDAQVEMLSARRAHIRILKDEDGRREVGAGISLLNGPSDDPVVRSAVDALKVRGFEISSRGHYIWALGLPFSLEPSAYAQFRAAQDQAYRLLIERQGNPDRIPGSVAARRVLGGLLAAGATVAGGEHFGGVGATVVLNAAAGDLYALPLPLRRRVAPCGLPELDAGSFTLIEVYPVKVNDGGSPGQVVVAYRTEKSDDISRAALVRAIVAIVGADTTPTAVAAARAQDLAYRKAVWTACEAERGCSGQGAPDPASPASQPAAGSAPAPAAK